jgi:hypothetical protein
VRFRVGYLAVIALAIALSIVVQAAAPLAYEGFSLTFPQYNTGSGFSGAWQQGGFNVFASDYRASDTSLSSGALQTSGGRVSSPAFTSINGAVRSLAQTLGADNTTTYLSVLLRPEGTLNGGVFNGFFGVTLNGSLGNELFVGKPGAQATGEYVLENRGGFGQVSSGVPTVVGQTALLVVRADFLAGNDLFTLYVNPAPGAPEPAAGVNKSDLNLGSVSRLGIYSTGAFSVDEIRLGATYADVTPRLPFAGTAGAPNCHGKTVAALAQQYGGLANAAAPLGYASVATLQDAITGFCGN